MMWDKRKCETNVKFCKTDVRWCEMMWDKSVWDECKMVWDKSSIFTMGHVVRWWVRRKRYETGVKWYETGVRWCKTSVRWCETGVSRYETGVKWCGTSVRCWETSVRRCHCRTGDAHSMPLNTMAPEMFTDSDMRCLWDCYAPLTQWHQKLPLTPPVPWFPVVVLCVVRSVSTTWASRTSTRCPSSSRFSWLLCKLYTLLLKAL